MTGQKGIAALVLVLILAGTLHAEEGPEIEIVHPPAGQALFGPQEIRVEVRSPKSVESLTVERLTVEVDGTVVATLSAPPYLTTADFGDENRDHEILVVAYLRSGATARARLLAPALRIDDEIDLDLQQLYVTATGRGKRRVLDLEAADFVLTDEGVAQEIVTFERGAIPFTAVLMLDGSQSMLGRRLELALAGARSFVAGIREFDEARLLVVADRLLEVSPFVGRGEPLAEALEGTAATGGTALYDYLFLAFKSLERRQGRRVVILLSDGSDVHSAISMDELRESLRRGETLIYWLRLRETETERERVFPVLPGVIRTPCPAIMRSWATPFMTRADASSTSRGLRRWRLPCRRSSPSCASSTPSATTRIHGDATAACAASRSRRAAPVSSCAIGPNTLIDDFTRAEPQSRFCRRANDTASTLLRAPSLRRMFCV